MKIVIHVQGIKGSQMIEKGEDADAMFGAILQVNDCILDRVADVRTEFGDEFTTVKATFIPGQVEVINHTSKSWKELCDQADIQLASVRAADGRLIARHES